MRIQGVAFKYIWGFLLERKITMKSANHAVLTALIIALIVSVCEAKERPKYRKSFINPYPRFEAFHDGGDRSL